ncbi:SCP-2 sterol transfer family protein [Mycolicibacterium arenosum]|uniref:SCP-2 sterol transfer family protein n=1 Tax=Mycolicibacterium arenosum TaxID=2952157 RepID=A0ABT1M9H2_9MYCO|nr:SCP-2 sterol transfer family protein [Mycolicibacterium sp. CAU 1645]MCP9275467.1 SCP-2 sterol transfer family protein [Mycolicibacterium sp. CAU 1645]
MAEGISALLRQSVGHLAEEAPDSYRLLLDKLGELKVNLEVDGEYFHVVGGRRLDVYDGAGGAVGATITTTRAAMLDVLDANVGLREAVEAGTVSIRGSLDNVLRAHDAIIAYVHAAVRAPSQPELLVELRAGAS